MTGVAGDENAIGYFGYAYYVENQDKLKAVEIDGGSGCVAPTDDDDQRRHVQAAEPAAVHLPEHRQGARRDPSSTAFVDYYLDNANTFVAEVGYVGPAGRPAPEVEGRPGRPPSAADSSQLLLDAPAELGSSRCVVPSLPAQLRATRRPDDSPMAARRSL